MVSHRPWSSPMSSSPTATAAWDAIGVFVGRLRCLSGEQVTMIARASEGARASIAGEVEWWRATAIVSRDLRRRRRSRRAAVASLRASEAVRAAPGASGAANGDVLHAARAAGEVARALVAGGPISVWTTMVPGWRAVIDATAAISHPDAA